MIDDKITFSIIDFINFSYIDKLTIKQHYLYHRFHYRLKYRKMNDKITEALSITLPN